MNKDECDVCARGFKESELFSVQHWLEDKRKLRMSRAEFFVVAFNWVCEECLCNDTAMDRWKKKHC